jgi:hypothetical protein
MLRRSATLQRPRQHQASDARRDAQTAVTICASCREQVFGSALCSVIAGRSTNGRHHEYTTTTPLLYESILQGCFWCTTVGNAILTAAHLDYWTSHWEGSQSDGIPSPGNEHGLSSQRGETAVEQASEPGDDVGEMDETDDSDSENSGHPGFLGLENLKYNLPVHLRLALEPADDPPSFGFDLLRVFASVVSPDATAESQPPIPTMSREEDQVEIIFEILASEGKFGSLPASLEFE